MVLVVHEFIVAMLIVMVAVLAFRKIFMGHMGLKPGVLPLVCLGVAIVMAQLYSQCPYLKTSTEIFYLAGPSASMAWDAFFKYFFKK